MSLLRRRAMMADNVHAKNGLINGYYNNNYILVSDNNVIELINYPPWETTRIPFIQAFNIKQGDILKIRLNMIESFTEFVDFELSNGQEVVRVVFNKSTKEGEFVFENTDKDYNDINVFRFFLRNNQRSGSFVLELYINNIQIL